MMRGIARIFYLEKRSNGELKVLDVLSKDQNIGEKRKREVLGIGTTIKKKH